MLVAVRNPDINKVKDKTDTQRQSSECYTHAVGHTHTHTHTHTHSFLHTTSNKEDVHNISMKKGAQEITGRLTQASRQEVRGLMVFWRN